MDQNTKLRISRLSIPNPVNKITLEKVLEPVLKILQGRRDQLLKLDQVKKTNKYSKAAARL